ncbi:MAG: hypothetical protein KAT07_01390, partial [Calditrichia bacterium]|nr:hypothetical protein [Calditrichia bacterium]
IKRTFYQFTFLAQSVIIGKFSSQIFISTTFSLDPLSLSLPIWNPGSLPYSFNKNLFDRNLFLSILPSGGKIPGR